MRRIEGRIGATGHLAIERGEGSRALGGLLNLGAFGVLQTWGVGTKSAPLRGGSLISVPRHGSPPPPLSLL